MTKKNRSDTTKRRKRDMTPHYTRDCPPRAAESQKARLCATPVAALRSAPTGNSPFFPNSFENSRNLAEKARGLLDLWVTFCFHFLTSGKAGNQIEQFDLDS